jgi:hypothetical protein
MGRRKHWQRLTIGSTRIKHNPVIILDDYFSVKLRTARKLLLVLCLIGTTVLVVSKENSGKKNYNAEYFQRGNATCQTLEVFDLNMRQRGPLPLCLLSSSAVLQSVPAQAPTDTSASSTRLE